MDVIVGGCVRVCVRGWVRVDVDIDVSVGGWVGVFVCVCASVWVLTQNQHGICRKDSFLHALPTLSRHKDALMVIGVERRV